MHFKQNQPNRPLGTTVNDVIIFNQVGRLLYELTVREYGRKPGTDPDFNEKCRLVAYFAAIQDHSEQFWGRGEWQLTTTMPSYEVSFFPRFLGENCNAPALERLADQCFLAVIGERQKTRITCEDTAEVIQQIWVAYLPYHAELRDPRNPQAEIPAIDVAVMQALSLVDAKTALLSDILLDQNPFHPVWG